jgi:hypothetical protein
MKYTLTFLLACIGLEAKPVSIVTDDFVHKVAIIESNGVEDAVGDRGLARGAFQFHECAWKDGIAQLRRINGNLLFDSNYEYGSFSYECSFEVAKALLQSYEERMHRYGFKPTHLTLYMAFNMGFSRAKEWRFDIKAVGSSSRKHEMIYKRAESILRK